MQAVKQQLLFRSSWALLEHDVAGVLLSALKAHWGTLKATAAEEFVRPPPQARAIQQHAPLYHIFSNSFV
jgi:hypothetical protein